jgi:hypothetical protein
LRIGQIPWLGPDPTAPLSKSRQEHLDGLLARARERAGNGPEHADVHSRLDELQVQRDALVDPRDDIELSEQGEQQEEKVWKESPMEILDLVVEQVEKILEGLDKK